MTWTGTSSDNWNVAGNWDPAQVPGMGDTAVIPESKKAVVDDTTSVTLDCSGEVSVESGKTLWLTGTSYLKGGKLSGDGDVTIMVNDSELQWSGGSIEGNGTFTVGENTRLVIDTAYVVGITCPLENKGQVMLNAGDLCLYGGGTGAGTFTVSGGAYLYFEQGNYSIGGNFVNSGEMTIWDTSSVSFNAGYRQDSTGTLALKVWGSGSNEYCKLDVADAAELGGILEIDFINDYDPQVGDTFEIMTCGSRAGEFSEINSNMEGITLVPAYTGTGLTLTVSDGTTPEENVCEIGENKYTTLDSALSAAISGQTIKLLKSIDYDHSIEIVNKSITFDLNGFNLNILNTTVGGTIEENSGLYVKGNAAVSLEGAGEFNVTGTWYGVFAERDSESGGTPSVTVTNATGIGRDGVAAQYSKVTVKGDATSRGSTYSGVWASYENAEVIVEGDVYANGEMSMGVNTDTLASVTVKGSVIVDGDNSIGIKASDDGDVTVEGNVTVSGIDCIGVSFLSVVDQPSIVTIKGVIEAEKYILFEAEDESKWEYSLRDGDFDEETADYIYYTKDNVSFVYVSMFAGGSGTVEDPYLIAHANQLYNIKYYHFFGKHYKQIADIDLGGYFSLGEGWDPIGLGESPFLGVYDGDGHTISNLFITRPYQGDIGLFGCVGELSEILNVGLLNADVTGCRDVGGLAAINAGIIANSYVTGKVSGTTYAGGLIGYNMGSVTDSYFDGTVSRVKGYDTDEVEYAGGLVGCNSEEGSITGCYAKATVESGGPLIGGLAGGNLGSITDSHAISAVTGYYYVGGLTGSNEGIVNNSYADGNVTGTSLVGGLIGYNSSLLADSYFTGTVTASDDYTGGLVGDNSGGSIEGYQA
ncbi:MAG: GLUG motif-containing protein, partial [Saccharofermentanales bacterium]